MGLITFLIKRKPRDESRKGLMQSQSYSATTAGTQPVLGTYPVAGNGPNALDVFTRTHPKIPNVGPGSPPTDDRISPGRKSSQSLRPRTSMGSMRFVANLAAPSPAVPRFRAEGSSVVDRPSAPPEDDPFPANGGQQTVPTSKFSSKTKRETRTSTRGPPPSSFRGITEPGLESDPAPSLKSRNGSMRSIRGHGFKDILDAHSEMKHHDFRARVEAAGARDYGEDVADRNLGQNGTDLQSPSVKAFYATSKNPNANTVSASSSYLNNNNNARAAYRPVRSFALNTAAYAPTMAKRGDKAPSVSGSVREPLGRLSLNATGGKSSSRASFGRNGSKDLTYRAPSRASSELLSDDGRSEVYSGSDPSSPSRAQSPSHAVQLSISSSVASYDNAATMHFTPLKLPRERPREVPILAPRSRSSTTAKAMELAGANSSTRTTPTKAEHRPRVSSMIKGPELGAWAPRARANSRASIRTTASTKSTATELGVFRRARIASFGAVGAFPLYNYGDGAPPPHISKDLLRLSDSHLRQCGDEDESDVDSLFWDTSDVSDYGDSQSSSPEPSGLFPRAASRQSRQTAATSIDLSNRLPSLKTSSSHDSLHSPQRASLGRVPVVKHVEFDMDEVSSDDSGSPLVDDDEDLLFRPDGFAALPGLDVDFVRPSINQFQSSTTAATQPRCHSCSLSSSPSQPLSSPPTCTQFSDSKFSNPLNLDAFSAPTMRTRSLTTRPASSPPASSASASPPRANRGTFRLSALGSPPVVVIEEERDVVEKVDVAAAVRARKEAKARQRAERAQSARAARASTSAGRARSVGTAVIGGEEGDEVVMMGEGREMRSLWTARGGR